MAVLNTNTRYLHAAVVDYARRLAATLPDPLRVVLLRQLRLARRTTSRCGWRTRPHRAPTTCSCSTTPTTGTSRSLIDVSPYKFDGPGGAAGRARTSRAARSPTVPRDALGDDARPRRRRADGSRASAPGRVLRRVAAGLRRADRLAAGYLAAAFAAVRAAGGVCVADEVQVGFGRVGEHFWGFELQGVVPDIVTLGKPIGNGHPLGAVVTTPEIAALVRDRHGVLQHLRRQPGVGARSGWRCST